MSIYLDEAQELLVYNKRGFFVPINRSNKNKNSCTLLLTPNYKSTKNLLLNPQIKNLNMYKSLYTERDVNFIINSSNQLEESTDYYYNETKKYELQTYQHENFNDLSTSSIIIQEDSYKDSLIVYNNLSNKEKKFVSPKGSFEESPDLLIREIEYDKNKNPIAFIEVYKYDDKKSGFISIAVDSRFRGQGIAKKLFKKATSIAKNKGLIKLIYKLDSNNLNSKKLIESLGYKLDNSDKNNFTYIINLKEELVYAPEIIKDENALIYNEGYLQTKDFLMILDESKLSNMRLSSRFIKILKDNRIKTNKDLFDFYDKIKHDVPYIDKTYANLMLYKQYNLFIDFSYYSELFFKYNILKKDKSLDFYFTFLNKFINDERLLSAGYIKRTVFIPIEGWSVEKDSELWDYTKNTNIFSMIYRYAKNRNQLMVKFWNSIDFVFIGYNSFFKVRMENLNDKNINKFLRCLKTLQNNEEQAEKEKEIDRDPKKYGLAITKGYQFYDNNSSVDAITTDIIDTIDQQTNIYIYNLTGGGKQLSKEELAQKVASAISSGSTDDKKDALVAYVRDRASGYTNSEDTMQSLENDETMKRLIMDITLDSDTGIKFSEARLSRITALNDKFLAKEIESKTVSELLAQAKINTQIPKTNLPIDSIDDEWDNLTFMNFEQAYDIDEDIMSIMQFFSNKNKTVPIAVRDFSKEDISTSEDSLYLYTFDLEDAFGKRFKLKLEVPKFKNNRYMRLRGNDKIVSNQLLLLPIIKTGEDAVQIVSNYNKIFIYRYGTSGKTFVISDRINKAIMKAYKEKDSNLKAIIFGDNTKICAKYELPLDYIDLATSYSKIETKDLIIYFNQDEIRKLYKTDESKGLPFAFNKLTKKLEYFNGKDSPTFSSYLRYLFDMHNSNFDFNKYYELTSESSKYCYSQASILSNRIPLIIVMAYSEGLQVSLRKANIKYIILDKKEKYDKDKEDVIRFKDGYLKYELDYNSSLLLNGLKDCNTEDYSITQINEKTIWIDFLDLFGGRILADGLDNFYDLMIDPITKQVCEDFHLPTDYVSILAYGNMLLADNKFNRHIDISGNRIRSNEIVAGYFYKAIAGAYGDYMRQIKRNRKESTMSVKKSYVVDAILADPTESDASVINPILDREAAAACSFKGLSGMNNDRSYGLDKRTYDDSMLGVLAMSTGFAANVGLTRWASIDANITGKRGYIKQPEKNKMTNNKIMSMTESLTPFGTTGDDPFRMAMTFIQTSKHGMPTKRSMPLLVSTGADEALAYMSTDTFSYKAKANGIVKEVTDDYIIIEYDNKYSSSNIKPDYIDLRENVKKNSDGGFYITVKLDANVRKGQKVKAGQIIAYDKTSYSDEIGDGSHIIYNLGVLAKIAILVTDEGFEDSAIIDNGLSEMMASKIVVMKDVTLDKKTNVYKMLKPGDLVQEGDPLIIFQNAFDADDANALIKTLAADNDEINELGRVSLKSKVTGIVQDVKMYRTTELNELSPSLKKLFTEYESKINKSKSIMKKYNIDSNEYDSSSKLETTGKLKNAEDKILIEFYVAYNDKMGVGDKLVYYAALKGVIKSIFPLGKEPYTKSRPNEKIRAFLTASSTNARMVTSILKIGCLNKILIELDRKVKDIYDIKYPDNIE